MRQTGIAVTALVACLVVGGCGDSDPTGPDRLEEVARNLARWQRVGPDSYTYAVERQCFCPVEARGPVRVVVESGAVTERTYVESGEDVREELSDGFPSVAGLFGVLIDALERGAFELDVTWDPATGVPLDFFIDYSENIADEEVGYRVTEMPSA